jgi:hypothetical protein
VTVDAALILLEARGSVDDLAEVGNGLVPDEAADDVPTDGAVEEVEEPAEEVVAL